MLPNSTLQAEAAGRSLQCYMEAVDQCFGSAHQHCSSARCPASQYAGHLKAANQLLLCSSCQCQADWPVYSCLEQMVVMLMHLPLSHLLRSCHLSPEIWLLTSAAMFLESLVWPVCPATGTCKHQTSLDICTTDCPCNGFVCAFSSISRELYPACEHSAAAWIIGSI
jgi:hypothetical protein